MTKLNKKSSLQWIPLHGVGVWQEVKQIFTMPVNLQISNVQFSLHALHCLTSRKRLNTVMYVISDVQLCIT